MWTLAVLFALSATLLLGRQRIMERLPRPATFLLLRGPAKLPAVQTSDPGPDTERYTEAVRQKEATASRLRLWDEGWLPRTTIEALDVLGVDPDAGKDKMKTTVTRLRRALHPDHAIDEEDRALRERRLKLINVAWDFVSRKRRAPWLKKTASPASPGAVPPRGGGLPNRRPSVSSQKQAWADLCHAGRG
jgi:hypothetical protein